MILRIENLSCGYDSEFILEDIDFGVNEEERVGVIGPNGSGKTTLLRAITRILKPKKGKISFEGRDIWQTELRELAKVIAVVPQIFDGGDMNVEDFVLLGRIPHLKKFQFLESEIDYQIVERSMELTDTLRFKDKPISEISGGERQLVSIARALSQQPKLLLLDEPTAHLDIAHQIGILDLIKRLNKELGLTVIMVLHDLNLASEYCDRLILLDRGRIYRIGAAEKILTHQIIEDVYKTKVVIRENPLSKKPYIFLVSEERDRLTTTQA